MTIAIRLSRLGDLAALAAPLLVGGVGGAITVDRIPTWYRTLRKPAWNPPNGVFGPVWTTLYVLMGVAMVLVRHAPATADDVRRAEAVNALQLALNLGWTLAFFGTGDARAGVAAITLLWLSILAMIVVFARISRPAAALLLPYLAWVSFATALNVRIWQLNR